MCLKAQYCPASRVKTPAHKGTRAVRLGSIPKLLSQKLRISPPASRISQPVPQNKKEHRRHILDSGPREPLKGIEGNDALSINYERSPASVLKNSTKGVQWLPPKRKPPSLLNTPSDTNSRFESKHLDTQCILFLSADLFPPEYIIVILYLCTRKKGNFFKKIYPPSPWIYYFSSWLVTYLILAFKLSSS